MAQITTLQSTDFLKNSRTALNQNFTNLNTDLLALSAGIATSLASLSAAILSAGGSASSASVSALSADVVSLSADVTALNRTTRNLYVEGDSYAYGKLNDKLSVTAANILVGTTNPLLNGNITLSANNGYTIVDSVGPGLQIKDNIQQSIYGGSWVEFYRYNALSGYNILEGSVYNIKDAPIFPAFNTDGTEGMLTYGNTSNTSLFFGAGPGYLNSIPGIYIPSINAANTGRKVELIGPNGAKTQSITIGNEALYGNYDTLPNPQNNLLINPVGDGVTMCLSAFNSIKTVATNHLIATHNPLANGNITLSANNGYVIIETDGPGLQIKDNIGQSIYGGSWLEFYRTNALSGYNILEGSVYNIKDAPIFPAFNTDGTEGILYYGNSNNTSLFFGAGPGYVNSVPGIYIPSINASNNGQKIELIGSHGVKTRQITIGYEALYGNFDTSNLSANNLIIKAAQDGITVCLSAYQNIQTVATNHLIATHDPLANGNITLSANNGYIQHITEGTGTQLIDNANGSAFGGTWLEFYRENAAPGVHVGTVFTLKDQIQWPRFGDSTNEGLSLYGALSSTSISITSAPGINTYIPGFYIPSLYQAASGYAVEILGNNGALVQKLTIGNKPLYNGFDAPPISNVNLSICTNSTNTVYLSSVESTTTLQIGSVSAINFADNSTQTTAYTGAYTPAVPSNWNGAAPTTIQGALDRIAAAIKALNGVGP